MLSLTLFQAPPKNKVQITETRETRLENKTAANKNSIVSTCQQVCGKRIQRAPQL